ncbi:unnamed protein product [Arctogadus glacialis]
MPRTSVHRAVHTTSAKIAALFAQTVHHPTEEELVTGDVLDPEDNEAGAAEEEDPGREAAPPGTVSGAGERNRMAALCFAPDHDYF